MIKMITESDLKVLIPEDELQHRIKILGDELNKFYNGEELYVISVLKGSVMFTVDLVKHLKMPLNMNFIRLSSYGSGFTSTGKVNAVDISLPDLNDKNVLIVEDIIDTGLTLKAIKEILMKMNPASLKITTLLDKPSRRLEGVDIVPEYVGFVIPNEFVVGFGLDYDEQYRNIPYIGILKKEVYQK